MEIIKNCKNCQFRTRTECGILHLRLYFLDTENDCNCQYWKIRDTLINKIKKEQKNG